MGWKTAQEPENWNCPVFMRMPNEDESETLWACLTERMKNMMRYFYFRNCKTVFTTSAPDIYIA